MVNNQASNFGELLTAWAHEAPHDPVFYGSSGLVEARGFLQLSEKALAWVDEKGIKQGDFIAVYLVSRVEWLALFIAASQRGAILVPINTRYRSEEITYLLNKSKARFLITQKSFKKIDFSDILQTINFNETPSLEEIFFLEDETFLTVDKSHTVKVSTLNLEQYSPVKLDSQLGNSEVLVVFATSGTTSGPKLVMQTQRSLLEHAYNCAAAYDMIDTDAVYLAQLPLCGVFGLCGVLASLAARCPTVLIDNFEANQASIWIDEYKVSHTFGSDEMVRRLYELAKSDVPYPSLRLFGFGAFTTSFDEMALEICEKGIPLHGLYGSSEILSIFAVQSSDLIVEERIKGGGVPVAGKASNFRIRDDSTGELVAENVLGEIEVSAPSMFVGYLNDQESTNKVLTEDGFFKTGDVGYLRPDGSLVYQSRKGDAIRLSGFLVTPLEIEDSLKQIPGVNDAQVVAVEINAVTKVVAFLIVDESSGIKEDGVIVSAKNIMAPFKVPAFVWFVDDYPMTHGANGLKIQKSKLRNRAQERINNLKKEI